MATSKMSRQPEADSIDSGASDFFDFGEPEVLPVEISVGKFLYLKEPSAEDLIHIAEINENDNNNNYLGVCHCHRGFSKTLSTLARMPIFQSRICELLHELPSALILWREEYLLT